MNPASSRKPLTQSRALSCLLANQVATPGLGSILARRYAAGFGQLLVALAGFVMFVAWYVLLFIKQYQLMNDLPADEGTHSWLIKCGALVFGGAWVWSWFTSTSVMREAKRNTEQELEAPPKLKCI